MATRKWVAGDGSLHDTAEAADKHDVASQLAEVITYILVCSNEAEEDAKDCAAALVQAFRHPERGRVFRQLYRRLVPLIDRPKGKGRVVSLGTSRAELAAEHGNGAQATPAVVPLKPHQRKALEYVRAHPGTTVKDARAAIPGHSVLSTLVRLGHLELRGKQFYPVTPS